MFTSARALQEILVRVQAESGERPFLDVTAEVLKLENERGKGIAAIKLRELAIRVREDIEKLGAEDQQQAELERAFNPYRALVNLSVVHQTVKDLKQHVLKPEALVGLTTIDLALDGKVNYSEDRGEIEKLQVEVDELREALMKSDLPDSIKKSVDARLAQIRSVLINFRFWGNDNLQETLQQLVGALVLNAGIDKKANKSSIFGRLIKFTEWTAKFSNNLNKTVENSQKLASNFSSDPDVVSLISDSSKLAGE